MREAPAGRIISSKPKHSNAEACGHSMCARVGGNLLNQPLQKNPGLDSNPPYAPEVGGWASVGVFSGKQASLRHSRGPVVLSSWRVSVCFARKLHVCPLQVPVAIKALNGHLGFICEAKEDVGRE